MSESILHPEGASAPAEPAAPAAAPLAQADSRIAQRRKAQAASVAARKAKKAAKDAKKAKKAADAAGAADPADVLASMVKKELLDAPVSSARELAKFIAAIEESCAGLAVVSPKGTWLVRALQWSDGKGNPSPQCHMAAGFMWPWLKKQDAFGKLAAQADGLMFAMGCMLLLAPFLGAMATLFMPQRRPLAVVEQPADPRPAEQPAASQPAGRA